MRSDWVALRIERGFWLRVSSNVVFTSSRALTRIEALKAASLHYEKLALTGAAALEVSGLPSEPNSMIDLIGPRGGRVPPFPLCRIHTSRHEIPIADTLPRRTHPTFSVVAAVAWARSTRQAIFFTTWAIQNKLASLEEVRAEIASRPNSNIHSRARARLKYLVGGVESVPEHDFAKECRRRGLPEPKRQVHRRDSQGRDRFVDAEFVGRRGPVVVEVDGLGHLDAEVRMADAIRANELALQGCLVLRVTSLSLRLDPDPFFVQLRAALGM